MLWTWYRLGPPDSKTYPQAAEYDRIEFRGNQYNGLTPQQRPVALAIDRTLKLALQLPLTEIDPSSPLSLATGREVLQALQTASQRLLTETAEHRTKLEIDFAARKPRGRNVSAKFVSRMKSASVRSEKPPSRPCRASSRPRPSRR